MYNNKNILLRINSIFSNTMKYIIDQNDSDSYTLILVQSNHTHNNLIFQSLLKTNIVPFGFVISENKLYFKAESVVLLKECKDLSIEKVSFLIHFLIKQIKFLESHDYTFYGFDIDDIIIINEETFGIVTTDYIISLEIDKKTNNNKTNNNKTICFLTPFMKPYFSSPEIIRLTSLPYKLSYKSCYYSLASIAIYLFSGEYILKGNEIMTDSEIDVIMRPIYNTKLYWFLKRCLHSKAESRLLFYI